MTPNKNKLTLADIEAEIASEHYFTARDGVAYTLDHAPVRNELPEALAHVTFCVLILHNGHKVVGINHGPVEPANFDADMARRYAREDAIGKLWEPLGFRLRDLLHHNPPVTVVVMPLAGTTKPIGDEPPDMSNTLSFADSVADLNGTPRPGPMLEPAEPSRVITPTIGRKVWFYPGTDRGKFAVIGDQPLDATIVFVHDDRTVNLSVVDHAGRHTCVSGAHLVQPGDQAGPSCRAEWMPYQIKQAGA